jgi:hypothetical protein
MYSLGEKDTLTDQQCNAHQGYFFEKKSIQKV